MPRDRDGNAARALSHVGPENFNSEVGAAFDAAFDARTQKPASPWAAPPQSASNPPPGLTGSSAQFGPYKLIEHLGGSRELDVWKALHQAAEGVQRACIVHKLSRAEDRHGAVIKARMMTEGRVGKQLQHKNLVEIYDSGEIGGIAYIAREHVAGVNLRSLLELAGDLGLSLGAIVGIATRIASVLAYVHGGRTRSGKPVHLVHGELSPTTILIRDDGALKLTEVGVTVLGGKTLDPRTEARQGKRGYAAPEQVCGQPLDGKTDVFSLGIILTELVGGRPLPKDGSFGLEETEEAVRLWCTLRNDVPGELRELLVAMTAVSPAVRPEAQHLKRRLHTLCSSLGVTNNPSMELRSILSNHRTIEMDALQLDVDLEFEDPVEHDTRRLGGSPSPSRASLPNPMTSSKVKVMPLEIHTGLFEVPELPPELLKPADPQIPPPPAPPPLPAFVAPGGTAPQPVLRGPPPNPSGFSPPMILGPSSGFTPLGGLSSMPAARAPSQSGVFRSPGQTPPPRIATPNPSCAPPAPAPDAAYPLAIRETPASQLAPIPTSPVPPPSPRGSRLPDPFVPIQPLRVQPAPAIAPTAVVRGNRASMDMLPVAVPAAPPPELIHQSFTAMTLQAPASRAPGPHGSQLRSHAQGLGIPASRTTASPPQRPRGAPIPRPSLQTQPGSTSVSYAQPKSKPRWMLVAVAVMVLSAAAGIAVGLMV